MLFKDFLGHKIEPGQTVVYSTSEGRALVLARVVRCETYNRKPRVVVNRFKEGIRKVGTGYFDIDPKREVRLTMLDRVMVVNVRVSDG